MLAMSEEMRVKDEQLALLKQSLGVLEEEVAAKEGASSAANEKHKLLQSECIARDEQILVLSERLQAAQLEIKVGGSQLGRKNEELRQELHTCQTALADAQKKLEVHLLAKARSVVSGGGGTGNRENQGSNNAMIGVVGKSGKLVTGGPDTLGFFHNTALLVKALLSKTQSVSNLPIDELYEHVVSHEVPIEEWPQWILQRYGHG